MKLDRQIGSALSLQFVRDPYELRTYEVEQFSTGRNTFLQITRTYSQPGMRTEWHECFQIGPRGGRKMIYSNFY